MRTRSIAAALSSAALLAAMTAACGTSQTSTAAADEPKANDSGDCADDATATSTGPVDLTDSYGRSVQLDQPAERVAVLEWQQTEDVLSLCVSPVAVADPKGFATWDTAEVLPDGVEDVGGRGEPNMDALLGTDPDLVIVEAYTAHDAIIKQLEKYDIPVLATKGADAADPVQNMLNTFDLIARATGREERAQVVVDEFEDSIDEATQAVEDADVASTDFVYFDGWIQGGNVAIRPYGQGSLIGELGEAMGLTNAWTGKVDAAYGLGQTDIEGMTKVGDASFFYTGTDDGDSAFLDELTKNDIWSSLPAVADGRSYAFPTGIWTFGGPRSAERILDAYVTLLTA